MRPKMIIMGIDSQDLIGQLIKARSQQLEEEFPYFKQEYIQLQHKLKEHQSALKQNSLQNDELYHHVMQELELKYYKINHNAKFSSRPCSKQNDRKTEHKHKRQQSDLKSNNESSRSSKVSQMGFKPYNISNFSKSLQKLKISPYIKQ